MSNPDSDVLRELAESMNRLADSLNQFTALITETKNANEDWEAFPTTMAELNRRLTILCTRL